MMESIERILTIYKDYGVAGLFLTLYLITLWFFYKELKEREKLMVAITERVVTALDKSSDSSETTAEVLKNVGTSLDTNTKQTGEFIAFVRGRDSGGR